jgi:hypothetical protein
MGRARAAYYRRVFAAYLGRRPSHLTFWHETPELHAAGIRAAHEQRLGSYYMSFRRKALYAGPFDAQGIPVLDYRGTIGRQYNPIAIAQYALGNYNLHDCQKKWTASVRCVGTSTQGRDELGAVHAPEQRELGRRRFLQAAGWLLDNLERNAQGRRVWNHHFDWEYRTPLKAPWYSALAQGQGLSVLVRAHRATGDEAYMAAARMVFDTFLHSTEQGGVACRDESGNLWFEEAIVSPPTHILNGFIWAAWGIHDYWLHTQERQALDLFNAATATLRNALGRFDCGYWSLYEQSGTRLPMLASPFYHRLHITQLQVMYALTQDPFFLEHAGRWSKYGRRPLNRARAWLGKAAFKLLYY